MSIRTAVVVGLITAVAGPVLAQTQPAQQKSLASTINVYVFPTTGQTAEQQSTDEAACYNWAVQNTGSDPFALQKQAQQQQQQADQAQQQIDQAGKGAGAKGAVGGAAAGALIGEIVSDDAGKGAAYGAAPSSPAGGLREPRTRPASRLSSRSNRRSRLRQSRSTTSRRPSASASRARNIWSSTELAVWGRSAWMTPLASPPAHPAEKEIWK